MYANEARQMAIEAQTKELKKEMAPWFEKIKNSAQNGYTSRTSYGVIPSKIEKELIKWGYTITSGGKGSDCFYTISW